MIKTTRRWLNISRSSVFPERESNASGSRITLIESDLVDAITKASLLDRGQFRGGADHLPLNALITCEYKPIVAACHHIGKRHRLVHVQGPEGSGFVRAVHQLAVFSREHDFLPIGGQRCRRQTGT